MKARVETLCRAVVVLNYGEGWLPVTNQWDEHCFINPDAGELINSKGELVCGRFTNEQGVFSFTRSPA